MNSRQIKKILISAAALFIMLLCYALPFSQKTSNAASEHGKESQVATLSIPLKDNLLSSQPVSAPSPSLTIMNSRSSANGFNKKFFFQVFECNACSVISSFNFYLKKATLCDWQAARLHLALCVLRI